jgi:hypothetical protein
MTRKTKYANDSDDEQQQLELDPNVLIEIEDDHLDEYDPENNDNRELQEIYFDKIYTIYTNMVAYCKQHGLSYMDNISYTAFAEFLLPIDEQ